MIMARRDPGSVPRGNPAIVVTRVQESSTSDKPAYSDKLLALRLS